MPSFVNSLFAVTILALISISAAHPFSIARSVLDPKVSLSYKQTHICETTPGVKSYSGYVNLPPNPAEGRNYPIHTFFWFFEARKDPANAPLSLWLQGGPGSPSTPAALGENGPCLVNSDSKSTRLNQWSWNNEVNMLYLDQPVQTGFSYDTLTQGVVEETQSPFVVTPVNSSTLQTLELNSTFLLGTFPSQDPTSTANTTVIAAQAAWHFMQTFMNKFPVYKPKNNKFSIWGESYAGHWAPTFADYFETQNERIADGTLDKSAVPLRLETLGIVNGCLDPLQIQFYPHMAYNSTYEGLQIINKTVYDAAVESWPACQEKVNTCRSLAKESDPLGRGNNATVNKACSLAFGSCFDTLHDYYPKDRNVFDLTAKYPGSFPPKWAAGYLNTKTVQDALGVPLNFSALSYTINNIYPTTGDFVRGRNLAVLGELLDRGVKVALMYGDRDFQCNWLGGEQISLQIKSGISASFQKAGYADIRTNKTYVGGKVRQFGNLSFSRVFDAGHEVPYYQPETAYRVFQRVMNSQDVGTGRVSTNKVPKFSTNGLANIFSIKNEVPEQEVSQCYVWDIMETCDPIQTLQLKNGTAITKDFVMIGYHKEDGSAVYY